MLSRVVCIQIRDFSVTSQPSSQLDAAVVRTKCGSGSIGQFDKSHNKNSAKTETLLPERGLGLNFCHFARPREIALIYVISILSYFVMVQVMSMLGIKKFGHLCINFLRLACVVLFGKGGELTIERGFHRKVNMI